MYFVELAVQFTHHSPLSQFNSANTKKIKDGVQSLLRILISVKCGSSLTNFQISKYRLMKTVPYRGKKKSGFILLVGENFGHGKFNHIEKF